MGAAFFGGDDDDTRSATCAIKSRGSCVFQYGDGLDIALRDVREAGVIGCAVHDNQGVCASVHGGYATNVHATLTGARSARATAQLQSRHGTYQCVCHVGGYSLAEFL